MTTGVLPGQKKVRNKKEESPCMYSHTVRAHLFSEKWQTCLAGRQACSFCIRALTADV